MTNLACVFWRYFGQILSAFFGGNVSISERKHRKPLKTQGFAHSRTNQNAYLCFEGVFMLAAEEIFTG